MTEVYRLKEIRKAVREIDVVRAMEQGFSAYSRGEVVVPPVGEMIFEDPPGDVHIKYGYMRSDDFYVIKIASGFYNNPELGISSCQGMMLLFDQKTGVPRAVLLDEGFLTDIRTAAAGAVAAKYLAPSGVNSIGVLGAGIQGRLQVQYLKDVVDCRNVLVWGISQEELKKYKSDMEKAGYRVETTLDARDVASCSLIITATPSKKPLLQASWINKGTHITAMGSDTPDKQELDSRLLAKADRVVADSLEQCRGRGEIHCAVQEGVYSLENAVELGAVIADPRLGRRTQEEITVADLTGVAVQDIQIAKAVYFQLKKGVR